MNYISREEGAKTLGVSTRTIDRYVKKGKISYKKVSNKVMLLEEDVLSLLSDFNSIKKEAELGEIVHTTKNKTDSIQVRDSSFESKIDKKVNQFFTIFKETEKTIQEKDKLIFTLQQKLGEMEAKISSMIALPDYSKEKQTFIIEKQKLSEKLTELQKNLKNEKIKSTIWIGMLISVIVLGILLVSLSRL